MRKLLLIGLLVSVVTCVYGQTFPQLDQRWFNSLTQADQLMFLRGVALGVEAVCWAYYQASGPDKLSRLYQTFSQYPYTMTRTDLARGMLQAFNRQPEDPFWHRILLYYDALGGASQ